MVNRRSVRCDDRLIHCATNRGNAIRFCNFTQLWFAHQSRSPALACAYHRRADGKGFIYQGAPTIESAWQDSAVGGRDRFLNGGVFHHALEGYCIDKTEAGDELLERVALGPVAIDIEMPTGSRKAFAGFYE